jgi:hypothetical protein
LIVFPFGVYFFRDVNFTVIRPISAGSPKTPCSRPITIARVREFAAVFKISAGAKRMLAVSVDACRIPVSILVSVVGLGFELERLTVGARAVTYDVAIGPGINIDFQFMVGIVAACLKAPVAGPWLIINAGEVICPGDAPAQGPGCAGAQQDQSKGCQRNTGANHAYASDQLVLFYAFISHSVFVLLMERRICYVDGSGDGQRVTGSMSEWYPSLEGRRHKHH